MTKDEFELAIRVLKDFCESDKRLHGWEKSYFSTFLDEFKKVLFPKGNGTSKKARRQKVDAWMELMAFCEMMCQISWYDSGREVDRDFDDVRNIIREGLWHGQDIEDETNS